MPLPSISAVLKAAVLSLALFLQGAPAGAVSSSAPDAGPLVIGDDRGGHVLDRARTVRALRQSGRDVRIVGSVCYSTCTMLLGLPNTCVSQRTVFGFHGPSVSGRRLDPVRFEQASHLIAAHYPARIRAWYLAAARYESDGLVRVTGSDLIAIGVRAC